MTLTLTAVVAVDIFSSEPELGWSPTATVDISSGESFAEDGEIIRYSNNSFSSSFANSRIASTVMLSSLELGRNSPEIGVVVVTRLVRLIHISNPIEVMA